MLTFLAGQTGILHELPDKESHPYDEHRYAYLDPVRIQLPEPAKVLSRRNKVTVLLKKRPGQRCRSTGY